MANEHLPPCAGMNACGSLTSSRRVARVWMVLRRCHQRFARTRRRDARLRGWSLALFSACCQSAGRGRRATSLSRFDGYPYRHRSKRLKRKDHSIVVVKHEQMHSVVGWSNVLWHMVDGMNGTLRMRIHLPKVVHHVGGRQEVNDTFPKI